jgi:hypothetical protein
MVEEQERQEPEERSHHRIGPSHTCMRRNSATGREINGAPRDVRVLVNSTHKTRDPSTAQQRQKPKRHLGIDSMRKPKKNIYIFAVMSFVVQKETKNSVN